MKKAENIIQKIRLLPITFISASDSLVMEAAKIKGKYPISYADAFAAETAQRLDNSSEKVNAVVVKVKEGVNVDGLIDRIEGSAGLFLAYQEVGHHRYCC